MRLPAVERRYSKNRFHGKQIAKLKVNSPNFHLVIPGVAIRYLNPWPHNDTFFRLSTS